MNSEKSYLLMCLMMYVQCTADHFWTQFFHGISGIKYGSKAEWEGFLSLVLEKPNLGGLKTDTTTTDPPKSAKTVSSYYQVLSFAIRNHELLCA